MRSYSALVRSVQGIDSMLNQSQIDSIFDYASSAGRMSKLVLVVDDSDFMRMMLTDILGRAGHRVVQHGSGEECLEKLQADNGIRADVCVLDINMPGLNGLEVLKGTGAWRGRFCRKAFSGEQSSGKNLIGK